jgi:RNA polymerase sigma factor (sigma-70 family)
MTTSEETDADFVPGSDEFIAKLVEENMGWATSIAKSVARAWNMDWQLDGLDGGAYEGLLFCARRFDPARGVPFRGYARRRIHEACTEEARKSKSWQRGTGANTQAEQDARELSAKLFNVFPELRSGFLPSNESSGGDPVRSSVRQLLTSASLMAAFEESGSENPEIAFEYKQLIGVLAELEPVHQEILYAVYYRGQSMRKLAEEWKIDDLSVIREHKEILRFLSARIDTPTSRAGSRKLKIRRGLRTVAQQLRKTQHEGSFSKFLSAAIVILILTALIAGTAPLNQHTAVRTAETSRGYLW